MAVRVALADDSFLVREALAGLLAAMADVELVAACRDVDELRAAVDDTSPDIVLTEIPMPPSMTDEGLRLAAELRETHPETAVIALSDECDPAYALTLLESGAEGRAYLLKERLHTAAFARPPHHLPQADGDRDTGRALVEQGLRSDGIGHRSSAIRPGGCADRGTRTTGPRGGSRSRRSRRSPA